MALSAQNQRTRIARLNTVLQSLNDARQSLRISVALHIHVPSPALPSLLASLTPTSLDVRVAVHNESELRRHTDATASRSARGVTSSQGAGGTPSQKLSYTDGSITFL